MILLKTTGQAEAFTVAGLTITLLILVPEQQGFAIDSSGN